MNRIAAAIAIAAIAGCTSLISPRIDEATDTTLAQRCVDYRASMEATAQLIAALRPEADTNEDAATRLKAAQLAYDFAATWIAANCPAPPAPAE